MLKTIHSTHKGLNLQLNNLGSINYFVGKNGCGKTRLIDSLLNQIDLNILDPLDTNNWKIVIKPAKINFIYNPTVIQGNNNLNQTAENGLEPITTQYNPDEYLFNAIDLIGIPKIDEPKHEIFERSPENFNEKGIDDLRKSFNHDGNTIFQEITQDLQLDSSNTRTENHIPNYFSLGTISVYDIFYFEKMIEDFKIEKNDGEKLIILIDEIEIHLHPTIEKQVPNILNEIINKTNSREFVQFFITTHSLFLIKSALKENELEHKVYHLDNGTLRNEVNRTSLKNEYGKPFDMVLSDLGFEMKDIFYPNGLIYVEGPTEVLFLTYWLEIYFVELGLNKNHFVKGVDYDFVEFGGSLAAHLTLKFNDTEENQDLDSKELVNIFSLNRKVFLMVDNDNKNAFEKTKIRLMTTIKDINNGSVFYRNEAYSTIEDLLEKDAKISTSQNKLDAAMVNVKHWRKNNMGFDKFRKEAKLLTGELFNFISINNYH
jgi:predicted ATP-dependent endonuclease of OLD family